MTSGQRGATAENSGVTHVPRAPAWPLALTQGHRRPVAHPSEEGPVSGAQAPACVPHVFACPVPQVTELWDPLSLCRPRPVPGISHRDSGALQVACPRVTATAPSPAPGDPPTSTHREVPLQSRSCASTSWSLCLISDPPPRAAQGRTRHRAGARASANTAAGVPVPTQRRPCRPRRDSPAAFRRGPDPGPAPKCPSGSVPSLPSSPTSCPPRSSGPPTCGPWLP